MWFDKLSSLTYTHFLLLLKYWGKIWIYTESISKLDSNICCDLIVWSIKVRYNDGFYLISIGYFCWDYTCNFLCEFGFWNCIWNKVCIILNGKWHNVKCSYFEFIHVTFSAMLVLFYEMIRLLWPKCLNNLEVTGHMLNAIHTKTLFTPRRWRPIKEVGVILWNDWFMMAEVPTTSGGKRSRG